MLACFSILTTCSFPFECFSFSLSLHLVVWVFSSLLFLFSVFVCISHFILALRFPQCVCPNTSSLFGASLLAPGMHKGLKFGRRRLLLDGSGGAATPRSGQARHRGSWSIHSKHPRAGDVEEDEHPIPPPGCRLSMEAHPFPLASPQSPLLLLTVCPKLIERKKPEFLQ